MAKVKQQEKDYLLVIACIITKRNQTKVITGLSFLDPNCSHDIALHNSTVECPSPTGCKGM